MAESSFEVKNYRVGLPNQSPGYVAGDSAVIVCFNEEDTKRLIIKFMPPEVLQPNLYVGIEAGQVGIEKGVMNRPSSEFSLYIDLLRNERPVRAHIITEEPEEESFKHYLTTGLEPAGEGDGYNA